MSFWQAKTKIRKSDALFSEFIRCRDMRCVYAKKCNGQVPYKLLTCSHFFKRRKESVRFDPDNCDAACRKCHMWVEDTAEGQAWLYGFKLRQLGQQRFNALQARQNASKKRDDTMDVLYVSALLTSLGETQKAFKTGGSVDG